ncbi:hypothetical protein QYE76_060998, partial [Lolium multiflorum]
MASRYYGEDDESRKKQSFLHRGWRQAASPVAASSVTGETTARTRSPWNGGAGHREVGSSHSVAGRRRPLPGGGIGMEVLATVRAGGEEDDTASVHFPATKHGSEQREGWNPPSVPGQCRWRPDYIRNLQIVIDPNLLLQYLHTKPASSQASMGSSMPHMASSINFNQFLEKEKLKSNGSNFTDWFRHVRIFLNGGNLQYVLDAPLGDPPETETDENMNKEFPELFGMLKAAEIEIKKEHQVLMVNKTTSFKKQGKSKGKNKKSGKKAAASVKPKSGPKPDAECYSARRRDTGSEFQSEVENQRNKKIKFLRSDRGGEYLSYEFGMHLKKCGILSQLTPPGTPQRNGVSERRNRTLLDMVRSMMSLTDLPLSFWSYALETAAFTLNRAPSKSVETTPYELWFNKKPKLSFLKVWGCEAYIRRENVPVPPTPTTEEANDNDHETSYETATEPRRSTRDRATPDWYDPCLNVMIVDNNDEDPATYEEAMMSPDSNKWQEAMKSEMGSMYDNKVWTLVDLPDSRKAVENKWIFKRKTDADGNITVYKARLVAKGFRQIQGVDYDETFSPVAKLKSVRILLAIAAFFDYEIMQMDVKTAFLNGDIEEELYMVQPKGFVDPKNADKVCKLQRSIYGLKQASRSWNRRFDKVIKDFGFIQCHGEACIYKKVSGSSVAFLILYVDDILLIGNDIELLSSKGSRRLIGLSQSTYLDKILKKFRMDESKKGFLPMLPGKVLSKTQGPATAEERERMSQIPYASAVGSI